MGSKKTDYDMTNYIMSIDDLLQTIVDTQKAMGIEPTVEEAIIDPDTKLKYKRFQRRSKEEEERYLQLKEKLEEEEARRLEIISRTVSIEDTGKPPVPDCTRLKELALNINPDDDGDDIYLCEFCSRLGYKKKYDPIICDNCTECIDCVEYSDGECSGCTYSRFREGRPYSDFLSLEQMISPEVIEVFDKIQRKDYDKEPKDIDLKFHVDDI